MIELDKLLEMAGPDDLFLDFCLWEYPAKAVPDDKYRSINLLYHSFAFTQTGQRMVELCNAIRSGVGDWCTVWGVKLVNGRLSWEFYFYDYARAERSVSASRLIEIISQYTDCDLQVNEDSLYFMFSVDIDQDLLSGNRNLDEINIYIGNPGSMVSSGISYLLTVDGMVMNNLYYFFDAEQEMPDIIDKITSSVHVQLGALDIDAILWPELKDCETIVVANKKNNDGIYFSRINVDQLIFFMEKMQYPGAMVEFVRSNKRRLDHLLYDVGIDYKMVDGELQLLKSSYYGVF